MEKPIWHVLCHPIVYWDTATIETWKGTCTTKVRGTHFKDASFPYLDGHNYPNSVIEFVEKTVFDRHYGLNPLDIPIHLVKHEGVIYLYGHYHKGTGVDPKFLWTKKVER